MRILSKWLLLGLSIALLSAQLQGMPLSVVEASLAPEPVINADSEYMSDRIIIKLEENSGGFSLFSFFSSDYFDPSDFNLVSLEKIVIKEEEPLQSGFFSMFSNTKTQTWYRAKLDDNTTVEEALEALKNHPKVLVAEPDYIYRTAQVGLPDETTDPNVGQQWYLENIKAPQAWEHLQSLDIPFGGSRDIIVAVIDTGVDFNHVDLNANMWVNSREILGNGQDDDGNGVVDDYYGYNALNGSGNPMDDHGHGTHVAGIIAMTYNNQLGGVGIASNVQIMAIKAANASGVLLSSSIASSINYAVSNGADIINMSFSGFNDSVIVREALEIAYSTSVLIASAGNNSIPNDPLCGGKPTYPASLPWVIGVMAIDQNNDLARFSNYDCFPYDDKEYEIAAPGVNIFSTIPNNRYASWSGTSMASPIIAGVAALIMSKYDNRFIYNSRFVMGQIASTSKNKVNRSYSVITDVYSALSKTPEPELRVVDYFVIDHETIHSSNNADGSIDAGETVDVGLIVRNRWGFASEVSITLDAVSVAGIPNPFIKFIVNGEEKDSQTISLGNIGNFSSTNNGIQYVDGLISRIDNPIKIKFDSSIQNDEIVIINYTIHSRNGLDESDSQIYTHQSTLHFYVKNAIILDQVIDTDFELTNDKLWIVDKPVVVTKNATLSIQPGTTVQFYQKTNDPYKQDLPAKIHVMGRLEAIGTEEMPIIFKLSEHFQDYTIEITFEAQTISWDTPDLTRYVNFDFVEIDNPKLNISSIKNSKFKLITSMLTFRTSSSSSVHSNRIESSHFNFETHKDSFITYQIVADYFNYNLVEGSNNISLISRIENKGNVFLNNSGTFTPAAHTTIQFSVFEEFKLSDNGKRYAILNIIRPQGPLVFIDWFNQINHNLAQVGLKLFTFDQDLYSSLLFEINNIAANHSLSNPVFMTGHLKTEDGWSNDPNNVIGNRHINILGNTGEKINEQALVIFRSGSNSSYFGMHNLTYSNQFLIVELNDDFDYEVHKQKVRDLGESRGNNNAILNRWYELTTSSWLKIRSSEYVRADEQGVKHSIFSDNYWGTNVTNINRGVIDFTTNYNLSRLLYNPLKESHPETLFPFVADAYLTNHSEERVTTVTTEKVFVNVHFNIDMDQSTQPIVTYGPYEPFTDYLVEGEWVTSRHWRGETNISPLLADGWQYISVHNAVAGHSAWYTTAKDSARFRFTVSTAGTAAMNLQASGEENQVRLQWVQDDYDLIAGFNIYRSNSFNGTFVKINKTIIPDFQKEYVDTNVNPGQTYYYAFTVVQTDFEESQFSNVTSATPIDNIPPVIDHTPITTANSNLSFTIGANITDNIAVKSVTLYYKSILSPAWSSKSMIQIGSNTYFSATIESSVMTAPGVLYYIQASDGVSITRSGSASVPHTITISDAPIITSVTPSTGNALGGDVIDIIGTNFKSGATVLFNNSPASEVTWISSTRLRVKTPPHAPSMVDVKVTNPDGYHSTLLKAYTYVSSGSEISLPYFEGYKGQIIQVPVYLASVTALLSLDLEIHYDSTVLQLQSVRNGSLTTSFASAHNTETLGVIRSALASSSYVSGDGSVLILEFIVIGDESETPSPLSIESAILNDGAIDLTLIDGQFTYATKYTLSGQVVYYASGVVIPDVHIRIIGNKVVEASSDEHGNYLLTNIELGEYTYQFSKSSHVHAISAMDASLALMKSVGLIHLDSYQMIAADVNMSGSVTSMDASYILQRAAGLITGNYPGSGKVWHFISSYNQPFLINQHTSNHQVVGILLGDISGNWSVETE